MTQYERGGAAPQAKDVMNQNDGDLTKRYYAELTSRGPLGEIAVALFRAQKRSSRAKDYRKGKFREEAYRVKTWSMSEISRLLSQHGEQLGFIYGWKEDPKTVFGERSSYVLYVDIPGHGQVSFHNPDRGTGPDYAGEWDGVAGVAPIRIAALCDEVMTKIWPQVTIPIATTD